MTRTTPIVLHHGLFGHGDRTVGPFRIQSFPGIRQAIEQRGHPVLVTSTHPSAGIATRAVQLRQAIVPFLEAQSADNRRAIIVAHSLGGLDARYLVQQPGMADHVQAIVSLSTPHRGSPWADWCTRHLGDRLGLFNLARKFDVDLDGARDVTTEKCRVFNETVIDNPRVRYFSVGASLPWNRIAFPLITPYRLIRKLEGENDGLVSLSSARWGEYLGDWPTDHWGIINRTVRGNAAGKPRDITSHYLRMFDQLECRLGSDVQ